MTKINKENYEAFLIDYLDGNLNDEMKLMLENFLDDNPEIKAEFEEFENISLAPINIAFENKAMLKQDKSEAYFDALIIDDVEGKITNSDKRELESVLKTDSTLTKKHLQYSKTKLIPDLSIVYSAKESLKQKTKIYTLYYYAASVAAILLLFVSFYNGNEKTTGNSVIAKSSEKGIRIKEQQNIKAVEEVVIPNKTIIYNNLAVQSSPPVKKEKKFEVEKREIMEQPIKTNNEAPVQLIVEEKPTIKEELQPQVQDTLPLQSDVEEFENIASLDQVPVKREQEFLTVGQALKEKFFKKNAKQKMNEADYAEAFKENLAKNNAKVGFEKKEISENAMAYTFTAGKFSISRTTKN